ALVGGSGGTLAVVVLLGLAALESQPARTLAAPEVARGRLLFETLGCRNCHSLRGLGGVVGPDLALVGLEHRDTAQFRQQLQDPQSHAADTPMPTFPLKGERMRDLVSFLASLGNDLRYTSEAPGLYRDNCSICHQLAGEGVGVFGPDLAVPGRIHSVAYVHQYIEEPSLLFSEASMPPSQSLTHEQVEDIARYVVATALRAEAQER
ncbi:MAG: cytochrome c, partial [Gemmatimonadales bacterium]